MWGKNKRDLKKAKLDLELKGPSSIVGVVSSGKTEQSVVICFRQLTVNVHVKVRDILLKISQR